MDTFRTHRRVLQGVTLIIASAFTLHLAAGPTHYRWINERGVPVHSDRPPPKGIDYEVISSGETFKRVVAAEEGAVPRETEPRVGNEFEKIPVDATNQIKKNPEICDRARENLTALETYQTITVKDDQGNDQVLSEEEKSAQRQEALKQIELHCD